VLLGYASKSMYAQNDEENAAHGPRTIPCEDHMFLPSCLPTSSIAAVNRLGEQYLVDALSTSNILSLRIAACYSSLMALSGSSVWVVLEFFTVAI